MVSHGTRHEECIQSRLLAPPTQRACAPLVLRVVGLPIGAVVRISATAVDRAGRPWTAEAVFRSTDTVVDVARDASVGGCYRGVDPDGLLTTMRPARSRALGRSRFVPSSPRGFLVNLAVRIGEEVVGTAAITRVLVDTEVTVRRFAIGGATVGAVWEPPCGQRRRPPVVVLAPARSPMAAHAPGLLASRGYPTVGIGLSARRPGLGWSWARRHRGSADGLACELMSYVAGSGIDAHGAVLLGVAEGAEAALRTAANVPDLGAVVAYLPARRARSIGPGLAPMTRVDRALRDRTCAGIDTRCLVVTEDPVGTTSATRPAGRDSRIGRGRDRWFTTPGWSPSGPGRLPGDAQGGPARHLGGEAWDLVLDLLRGLSISDGASLTTATSLPVGGRGRVPPDRGRSVR